MAVTVSRVLVVAIFVVSGFLAVNATPHLAGARVPAKCSTLLARRDQLHAETERLRAETDLVEAELDSHCAARPNQTDDASVALAQSQWTAAAAGDNSQKTGQAQAELVHPVRRNADNVIMYSTQCWANGSAFADGSCNCLDEKRPELGSRRTIRVVVGSWYASVRQLYAVLCMLYSMLVPCGALLNGLRQFLGHSNPDSSSLTVACSRCPLLLRRSRLAPHSLSPALRSGAVHCALY